VAIPDYQTLMVPVLRAAAEGDICVPAAAAKIRKKIGFEGGETRPVRGEDLPERPGREQ
jgi:restriction system protein